MCQDIKATVVAYAKGAILSSEIPDITGKKDWGSYGMWDLNVATVEMEPENLHVHVATGVQLRIQGVQTTMKNFSWRYNKTQGFPKLSDKGKAAAQIEGMSMVIDFELKTTATKSISIDNLVAGVTIDTLQCAITQGKNKWLVNKLLKVFQDKIKLTVQAEMQTAVDKTLITLREKIAAAIAVYAEHAS